MAKCRLRKTLDLIFVGIQVSAVDREHKKTRKCWGRVDHLPRLVFLIDSAQKSLGHTGAAFPHT